MTAVAQLKPVMTEYEQAEHASDLALCPEGSVPLTRTEIRRFIPYPVKFDWKDDRIVRRIGLCLAHPMKESFIENLKRMAQNGEGDSAYFTELGYDFAPLSFRFAYMMTKNGEARCFMHGGLIFHGSHDGGGDGGAPSLSVCLTPQSGWSMHT